MFRQCAAVNVHCQFSATGNSSQTQIKSTAFKQLVTDSTFRDSKLGAFTPNNSPFTWIQTLIISKLCKTSSRTGNDKHTTEVRSYCKHREKFTTPASKRRLRSHQPERNKAQKLPASIETKNRLEYLSGSEEETSGEAEDEENSIRSRTSSTSSRKHTMTREVTHNNKENISPVVCMGIEDYVTMSKDIYGNCKGNVKIICRRDTVKVHCFSRNDYRQTQKYLFNRGKCNINCTFWESYWNSL